MSLKNTLFRRNDGSAAFEIGQFQKQHALSDVLELRRVALRCYFSEKDPLMQHSPLPLSPLAPLRARLLNSLIHRALPLEFTADAGTETDTLCRLEANGKVAAVESPAPFAPAATLFVLTGDSLWKAELSSLEALALRPELAAWRTPHLEEGEGGPRKNEFSALPEALSLAVLERLFGPALDKLAHWLGCETKFTSAPLSETAWADPLPLTLTLPGGEDLYLRLFWSDERAARFVLERLESLPPRVVSDTTGMVADAMLRCPVEVGGMTLSPEEAAALAPGDILLPERWTPETPRLLLPGAASLVCRLENGVLSVLGRDATQPPRPGEPSDLNEVVMTESVSDPAETPENSSGAENAPLLQREELNAMELPVTFELASLSLRVEEVAALAPGYTFALSGDASSVPVFLRVGGRITAKGRLLDVGGMPGVQITGMALDGDGNGEGLSDTESQAREN